MNSPTPPSRLQPNSEPNLSTQSIIKKASIVLGFSFVTFVAWIAFAPLDEGVPTQGTVIIDSKRKTIQHLEGGWIKSVLVREGQFVSEGQTLLTLEHSASAATLEALRQHYWGILATEARLLAEQKNSATISFPTELTSEPYLDRKRLHTEANVNLFIQRRKALEANLNAIEDSRLSALVQLESLNSGRLKKQQLLDIIENQIARLTPLVEAGYVANVQLWDIQRQRAEAQSEIEEQRANITRLESQAQEAESKFTYTVEDHLAKVAQDLADAQGQLQADREKIAAALISHDHLTIKAPVKGQVIGLQVHTPGAVVTPGQVLMELIPETHELVIEAKLAPHLIDRIHPGQLTDVRFSAFAHSPMLVIQGKLKHISQDTLIDPDTRQPYYLLQIEVTPEGIQTLSGRELQAGMSADIVIKTGERSLLKYLTYPLTRRLANAMREE